MMGRESSLLSHYYPTCLKMHLFVGLALALLIHSRGLAEAAVSSGARSSRQNSRFLRTFPSTEFLRPNFNHISPYPSMSMNNHMYKSRREPDHHLEPHHHLINGNSPVFYIRLPPAPYMFIPGLGYVSPHPYNSPLPGGMSPTGGMELKSESSSHNNVISLPLKFISNGRPALIESPYPKKTPFIIPTSEDRFHLKRKKPTKISDLKMTELISGGKYSFNGRPSGVFVVHSPAHHQK